MRIVAFFWNCSEKRKKDNRFFCLSHLYMAMLCTVVLSAFFPMVANAADTTKQTVTNSRHTVRVGMFPRYGYHNIKDGKPVDGYGFDYLQRLRSFAPWNYQYSAPELDWSTMLPMLETGKIDMVSCVLKTPEREAKFAFSKHPAGNSSLLMTVKAGNKRFLRHDYSNWNGIRVGMPKGGRWSEFFVAFSEKHKFTFKPVYYLTQDEMLGDLQAGKNIDAAITNDFRELKNEWLYETFGSSEFYIAVRKSDRALLSELDHAMEVLNTVQPEFTGGLRRKYNFDEETRTAFLSAEEKAFIRKMKESGKVFTAIMNPDRKPISSINNGQYQGALKDIADEIIKRTGLNVRFIPVQTREEYQQKIQEFGKIDLVFDLIFNPAKAEKLHYVLTEPYFSTTTSIVWRKGISGKFQSRAVIIPSNDPVIINERFIANPKIIKVKNVKEALTAVMSGQADAFYIHTRTAEHLLLQNGAERLSMLFSPDIINQYCIGVLDSNDILLSSIMNKAASSIDHGMENRTYFKYRPKTDTSSFRKLVVQHPIECTLAALAVMLLLGTALIYVMRNRRNIRRERDFLNEVIHSSEYGIIITDCAGYVLEMNQVAEQMMNLDSRQAQGQPIEAVYSSLYSFDIKRRTSIVRMALAEHHSAETPQPCRLETKDGAEIRMVTGKAMIIRGKAGREQGIFLVIRDVTDEIKREQKMRQEIASWKAVSEIAKIYRFELKYKTRELSGNIPQEIWPIENGIATSAENWIVPEDIPQWSQDYQDLISGKKSSVITNHRVCRNGEFFYFREFMEIMPENPNVISGVIQDVTNVIVLQQHQDVAMRLWQTCINALPLLVYIKSGKDFRYLQCNSAFAEFMKRAPEEIIGKTDEDVVRNPRNTEIFRLEDRQVINSGEELRLHQTINDENGKSLHLMTIKVPATNADGEPIVIGISVNETEEYLQKMRLQNLLENRDAAAELANVASYQINCKTMEMSGSKNLEHYWPIENGKGMAASKVVLPENADECKEKYEAIINGTLKETTISYRIQKDDGIHYFKLYARKATHMPDTITGLMIDITAYEQEKKKAEALNKLWISVANSIPAILFVKDVDDNYRYLYVNKGLEKLFNRKKEEIIGHKECEFMSEEDSRRIQLQNREAMRHEHATECYEIIRDANNIDHHYQSIKIPSVNEYGHRIMIQMTTDVTEMQELSEVRKIVSDAFENLFFSNDLNSGIYSILKRVSEFIGFSRAYVCCLDEEMDDIHLFATYLAPGETSILKGKRYSGKEASKFEWYQNIQKSHKGDSLEMDFSNASDAEKCRENLPLFWKEKDKYDIRAGFINYLEVNGRPWGYVAAIMQHENAKKLSANEKTLLNMTANIIELAITRKRSYLKLQTAMEEAKAAALAKSNFLATMSHEIRTPLNSVLGFAELLKDPRLDADVHREYLQNITDSGNILLGLINDILDLSKLSANKMVFSPVRTVLLPVVSQIGMFFTEKCRRKGLQFIGAIPPDLPDVWIDVNRIRQLLFNLIGNAVKFTENGSITVKVSFTKDAMESGTLVISVEDTGIGIAPDEIEHLLQPFYQTKAVRGSATGNRGTGLGLAICNTMLQFMGGKLMIESTLGKGSTFTAVIPNIKYCSSAIPEVEKPISAYEHPLIKDFSNVSVLVVDDVSMNLKVLQAMLKRLGINAETAINGEEAFEKIGKQKFDFVLTDLWMPGINGAELAAKIRLKMKDNAPRIAVVTADIEGRENFDFSIFDGILTKPITALAVQRFLESA